MYDVQWHCRLHYFQAFLRRGCAVSHYLPLVLIHAHLDAISGSYVNVQRCVIADDYKLILYPKIKKALLFDLKSDPEEMNDLAGKPESKKRMKTLFNSEVGGTGTR